MKQLLFVTYSLFFLTDVSSQSKTWYYWVALKDKDTVTFQISHPEKYLSNASIERRKKHHVEIDERDIPVSEKRIQQLASNGRMVAGTSKWLNAVVLQCDQKNLNDTFMKLGFVKHVVFLGERKRQMTPPKRDLKELITALEVKVEPEKQFIADSTFYGKTFTQLHMLNITSLHQAGFHGAGKTIAVLDAGFKNLDKIDYFKYINAHSKIKVVKDMIEPATGVYEDDEHGTCVMSCMAACLPHKAMGSAWAADYMLIRTEDAGSESLIEEAMWVMGAEFADSAGADIIQSSLGYNEFDDMRMNHKIKELNGKSTIISQGAKVAVQKGIFVINSSGNEGDKDWRSIVAPADVDGVCTVGGVDVKGNLTMFSSLGPTADRRVKPDVVAMAESTMVVSGQGVLYPADGTSYACPLVSGSVACLMQACPDVDNTEILDALRSSGDNYEDPDKYFGYGIPDFELAYRMLNQLNKETKLLDARYLHDRKMHLTFYSAAPQRLSYEVKDAAGKVIYKDDMNAKSQGIYRFPVGKSNKWASGQYQVVMTSGESGILINIVKP